VQSAGSRIGSFVIALATALAIIALVIPFFLNPYWVAFEQGRAQATAWTGYGEDDLRVATDAILADLVLGPPDFDVAVAGEPVLNDRERGHMQDVFIGFYVTTGVMVAAASVVVVRRRERAAESSWRSVRSGALGLIVGLVLVGGFAFIAFDVLFELFHRIFFAGGSYTFDPATERLVQLFPFQFWQETAIAVGAAAIVVAAIVAGLSQRRLRPR
jgi:integral membrane protein (TIGR01906 family)